MSVLALDDLSRLKRALCLKPRYDCDLSKLVDSALDQPSDQNHSDVVTTICGYLRDGLVVKDATVLIAALAACANKNAKYRERVFAQLATVCSNPGHLFAFFKFDSELRGGVDKKKPRFGRSQRKHIQHYYTSKTALTLAFHVTKYRARHGWKQVDVIRLAHVKPPLSNHGTSIVLKYVVRGLADARQLFEDLGEVDRTQDVVNVFKFLEAVETVRHSHDEHEVVCLVEQFKLAHEHVPTWMRKSSEVWRALVQHMPMLATLRNLTRLGAFGLLDRSESKNCVDLITERLHNVAQLRAARIHPISVLLALREYETGARRTGSRGLGPRMGSGVGIGGRKRKRMKMPRGVGPRGVLPFGVGPVIPSVDENSQPFLSDPAILAMPYTFLPPNLSSCPAELPLSLPFPLPPPPHRPCPEIISALTDAFYSCFDTVQPTNKKLVIAVDVDVSMSYGSVLGCPGLVPLEAGAALATIFSRRESSSISQCQVVAVTAGGGSIVPLAIQKESSLVDVTAMLTTQQQAEGSARIPRPNDDNHSVTSKLSAVTGVMTWAAETGQRFDAVIYVTDSMTSRLAPGSTQVSARNALRAYQTKTSNMSARLVVLTLTSGDGDIDWSQDVCLLGVAGFDASTLEIIRHFVIGDLDPVGAPAGA